VLVGVTSALEGWPTGVHSALRTHPCGLWRGAAYSRPAAIGGLRPGSELRLLSVPAARSPIYRGPVASVRPPFGMPVGQVGSQCWARMVRLRCCRTGWGSIPSSSVDVSAVFRQTSGSSAWRPQRSGRYELVPEPFGGRGGRQGSRSPTVPCGGQAPGQPRSAAPVRPPGAPPVRRPPLAGAEQHDIGKRQPRHTANISLMRLAVSAARPTANEARASVMGSSSA
jgi:hypothetical protein